MSAKSYNKTYIDMASSAFNADQPMSAYRAWNCLHNLQHLIDSSGQYRVNTVATTGKFLLGHGLIDDDPDYTPPPGSLSWEFPLTMMHPESPPNFDIRVAARISDDTQDAATVVAAVTSLRDDRDIWGGGAERMFFASASVTSETSSWVIDEQHIWPAPTNDYLRMLRTFTVTENGGTSPVRVVMVRFTVSIIATDPDQDGYITGVQFREFA